MTCQPAAPYEIRTYRRCDTARADSQNVYTSTCLMADLCKRGRAENPSRYVYVQKGSAPNRLLGGLIHEYREAARRIETPSHRRSTLLILTWSLVGRGGNAAVLRRQGG